MNNQVVGFLCVLFCGLSMVGASSRQQSTTHGQHDDDGLSGNLTGILILQNDTFLLRVKKSIDKTTTGFTDDDKKHILDAHNTARRDSYATDMMILKWDNALEKFAQAWASNCRFSHQTQAQRANVGNFAVVGENLAASTSSDRYPEVFVLNWNTEKRDYTYETNSCAKVCGHYTQNVWATTRFVGCGIKYCDPLEDNPWPGFFVVCSYGPVGNYVGQRPYKKGTPCSECPSDAKYCINYLCSTTQATDSSGVIISISTYLLCACMAISAVIRQVIV